jgi:hypothetical protein
MTPDTLLTELSTRGIALRRAGGQLMVSDPDRALTPGLSALIKRHKAALLALLNIPRDVSQLPLVAVADDTPAPRGPIAQALAVEVWPAEQARRDLLSALLSDPRCVEYYAADRALCEAIDREDETAIALAQPRFDQALAHAGSLAHEITNQLERIDQ